jgi:hypothetical protein
MFSMACEICGERQHSDGACLTLIRYDLCEEVGHWEYDCPLGRCHICHTNGNQHSLHYPLHLINIHCTLYGEVDYLPMGKGICENYSRGKGIYEAVGGGSGAGSSGQERNPGSR